MFGSQNSGEILKRPPQFNMGLYLLGPVMFSVNLILIEQQGY